MSILPDAEDRDRPIDGRRQAGEKEPKPRHRPEVVDTSPEWIRQEARQHPDIYAEATGANGELLPVYM